MTRITLKAEFEFNTDIELDRLLMYLRHAPEVLEGYSYTKYHVSDDTGVVYREETVTSRVSYGSKRKTLYESEEVLNENERV